MSTDLTVEVRLTRSQQEAVERAARQIGMDPSTFLRHAALSLAGDIAPQERSQYELNSIHREAASRGHVWTEAELRERGLPLYWSAEWVRARLAEGKSINQLAILCGARQRTVQHHVRVVHGLRAFRTLTAADASAVSVQHHSGEERANIAANLQVSVETVGKYLQGQPTDRERAAREMNLARPEPVPPNVQGLHEWSERLFAERAASLSWPTSTEVIAETFFRGNRATARDWTGKMVNKGRLVRLAKGWFDLAGQGKPAPEEGAG